MAEDRNRYFRVEARELADGLQAGVLALERGAGRPAATDILRKAHTLKGAARVVKQAGVADLVHALEGEVEPWREGGTPPAEAVAGMLRLVDAISAAVAAIEAEVAPPPVAEAPPAAGRPAEEPARTLRMRIGDLDGLQEVLAASGAHIEEIRGLAHELEELRRRLRDRAREGGSPAGDRGRAAGDEALWPVLEALEPLLRRLSAHADRAHGQIGQAARGLLDLRLVAVGGLADPLERVVRDAAQELGRKAAFRMAGVETRIDADVLWALRDALMHVVRNAVAHGIEPPSERVAAGKPPEGSVVLEAHRRGGRILLRCRDDGRGLDLQAIRAAAVARGYVSEAEAATLDHDGALRVLMSGGVSTRASADAIAGRGIGMDAVRDVLSRLKGTLRVDSVPRQGTTVEMEVPVTLSTTPMLGLAVGGIGLSVPLDAVRAACVDPAARIDGAGGRPALLWRGTAVPILDLAALLGETPGESRSAVRPAVVVQCAEGWMALEADRVLGISNAPVRPLPWSIGGGSLFSGATVDARGQPLPVLDPEAVARLSRDGGATTRRRAAEARLPLLVVDDSMTTRMVEQGILESAGYSVDVAASAEEALEKARERRYGLFVVDVEMPGMNGFEFVARTRADEDLRSTPAILVTSRGAPEDRRRGAEAGARAYVVKSEFEEGRFLEVVRGLVE